MGLISIAIPIYIGIYMKVNLNYIKNDKESKISTLFEDVRYNSLKAL